MDGEGHIIAAGVKRLVELRVSVRDLTSRSVVFGKREVVLLDVLRHRPLSIRRPGLGGNPESGEVLRPAAVADGARQNSRTGGQVGAVTRVLPQSGSFGALHGVDSVEGRRVLPYYRP
jgi:hypothetical protein